MSLKGNLKRVEKSYVADLENILKDISQKYEIYDVNTGHKISEEDLINVYIAPLIEQEKQYQCSAILVNGNRCSHKSLKETRYKYCKKHLFKDNQTPKCKTQYQYETGNYTDTHKDTSLDYTTRINEETCIQINSIQINCTTDNIEQDIPINTSGLIKHFIDNKLYYIDDKYIYNSDGLSKAGYLENDEYNKVNYILIDDPFILQNI